MSASEGEEPAQPVQSDLSRRDVVDPEMRGHIYALCTALGGQSVEESADGTPGGASGGNYALGDDALSCLKDLRRWLKFYDEKTNRYDAARCMAEMNLVRGDLLEIIAMWKEEGTADRYWHRLVLSCVELLVPLTWPFDTTKETMTRNHHRHIPFLRHYQSKYKQAILHHRSGKILKDIVRVALPSMAMPAIDRSERDDTIIKLVLTVFRNVAEIEHPMPTETDTGEEISRSATISAFAAQNVLDLILTVASGIGDEFSTQDVVVMEVLYHLVKGIDVEALFRSEKEEMTKKGSDLASLLKKEDEMKRSTARNATRHNRFGTTVWVQKEDGRRAFVPGQEALLGKGKELQKMDSAKKWKKPRGADIKGISQKTEFDMTVWLDASAKKQLREFVENFLDSGFNPLFNSIRRAIERDLDRLLMTHSKQFFYLVAWFLKAERCRRNVKAREKKSSTATADEDDGFGVVATVLNQETLIVLHKKMMEWYDLKNTRELQAAMRCLTEILYTVQDMTLSPLEDDQEIAENIQSRLFYEETTMDLLVNILKSYTKQPFSWLNDCTEMIHVHLKMLEKYSEQHEHMFVRSRRRAQTRRKAAAITKAAPDAAAAAADGSDPDSALAAEPEEEDEDEEAVRASHARAIKDRKFDFAKFERKMLHEHCVNTFVAYLRHYAELDAAQVMRAIKYFHRVFEKRKQEVLLFRLDIVDLFYRLTNPDGDDALPKSHGAHRQADQFVRHYLRRLFRKLEKRPALYVELLFSKLPRTLFFLENGYAEPETVRRPRPATELEVKPGLSRPEQIGVAVAALVDENKTPAVDWLKSVLSSAVAERKSWEAASVSAQLEALDRGEDAPLEEPKPPFIAVVPDSDERKTAMFKDGKLRLLLKLLGVERLDATSADGEQDESPDATWIIPSNLSGDDLRESLDLLKKSADDPPTFGELAPADLLRRKPKPRSRSPSPSRPRRPRAGLDSDSSGADDDAGEWMFEPGGPTARKPDSERKEKSRRRRRRRNDPELADDGEVDAKVAERRRKRREREAEKRARIKSALRIVDSDDDEDEAAFFAREAALRAQGPQLLEPPPVLDGVRKDGVESMLDSDGEEGSGSGSGSGSEGEGEEEEEGPGQRKKAGRKRKAPENEGEDDEMSTSTTVSGGEASRRQRRRIWKPKTKTKTKTKTKSKPKPRPATSSSGSNSDAEEDEDVSTPEAAGRDAVAVDGDGDTAMHDHGDADDDADDVSPKQPRPAAAGKRKSRAVVDSDDE